jgi:hypothetical protein
MFCRLDQLGLRVVGQRLGPGSGELACTVEPGEFDRWYRRCGGEGIARDSVTRRLAHEPEGCQKSALRLFGMIIPRVAAIALSDVGPAHRMAWPVGPVLVVEGR